MSTFLLAILNGRMLILDLHEIFNILLEMFKVSLN
jgi:hypothetical protein